MTSFLLLLTLVGAEVIAIAARMPAPGLALTADGTALRIVDGPAALRAWPQPLHLVALSSRDARHRVEALVEADSLGSETANVGPTLFPRQKEMAAIGQSASAIAHVRDGQGAVHDLPVAIAPQGLDGLTGDIWLLLGIGLVSAAIGMWLLILRPEAWAARMVALAGVALLIAGGANALLIAGGIMIGAMVWVVYVNWMGVTLFAMAMIGLLGRHPKPLITARQYGAIATLLTGWYAWGVAAPELSAGLARQQWMMLTAFVALVVLASLQWRASRRDPAARVFLRWVGVVALLSFSLYVAFFHLPVMLGERPWLTTAQSFLLFLPFYGGLAIGIGRFRFFDLDRWSYGVMLYALAAAALLAVDLTLMGLFNLAPSRAWIIAAALVTAGWLLLRGRLWRWIAPNARHDRETLFRSAVDVVLTRDEGERHRRWHAMLETLFRPLTIERHDEPLCRPTLVEDGVGLALPAVAGAPPLLLRYPWGGRGLFGSRDLAVAQDFATLCAEVEHDRAAYEEAVRQERDRIAQDLHDDVGARLLTSLHRDNPAQIRGDVRAAIADIRSIIGGLAGERTPLPQALAVIRHESTERLAAAGLTLDWPITIGDAGEAILLDYAISKNLASAVREIASNIIRHAQARHVAVDGGLADGRLWLSISDDGIGFDPASVTQGYGLVNIERRIAAVGGNVAITPGMPGTRILINLPAHPPVSGVSPALSSI
ncbi:ATP-binding protein [Sphingobium sp. sgz301303]